MEQYIRITAQDGTAKPPKRVVKLSDNALERIKMQKLEQQRQELKQDEVSFEPVTPPAK